MLMDKGINVDRVTEFVDLQRWCRKMLLMYEGACRRML